MQRIPLTNPFGQKIGEIEIEDVFVNQVLETTPTLWLGYRVRNDEIEKFILRIDG